MKIPVFILGLFFVISAFGQTQDPACREFQYIQKTMNSINAKSVDRVIPYADWLDVKYRRQDQIQVGGTIARTVILILLQRVNVFMYVFTPSRAEAATLSGSYVRNPQSYVRFLQLPSERACRIMRLGGSDTQLLRDVTHDVYLELRRASR